MNLRSLVASALVVLFAASTSHAQTPYVSWKAYAERVGPKSLVVVQLASGASLEGHIIQVDDDAVSVLPKTRSGKLLRRSIQALCEGRDPGDLTTIEDPTALEQIRTAVRA